MSIIEAKNQIVQQLSGFTEWEDKYKHIIKMGKDLAPLAEEFHSDDYKINGCQSQVWLRAELDGQFVKFSGDSDAMIVKGLVALLLKVYSNRTPQEIISLAPDFLKEIGLDQHLSQNRTNGLASMIKKIKMYALGYQLILQKQQSGS